MGQRKGEISTGQAARLLEVMPRTLRRWARRRLEGLRSPIHRVREDVVGRYWFDREEVKVLAEKKGDLAGPEETREEVDAA